MAYNNRWATTALLCCLSVLASSGLHADSSFPTKPKGLPSPPLADSVDRVVQAMSYIDTRLLSEEHVKRIEASKNYEAIAILHRSLSDRELIEAQINQGRFEEAYIAMRAIGERIATSIKRSWADEQLRKKSAAGSISAAHGTSLIRIPAQRQAASSEG